MATYKAKNKAGIGPKTKKQQRASDQEPTPMQMKARDQAEDIRYSREEEEYFREQVAKYPPKMIAETSVEDLAKMGVEKLRKLLSENEYHQYSAMGVEGPKRETVGGMTLKQLKENEEKINMAGQMAYDRMSESEKSRLRRKGEGYNPVQYKKIKNLGESVIRF